VSVRLGHRLVALRTAVEELDPAAYEDEEWDLANALVVEDVAALIRSALASLREALDLRLRKAGVNPLVIEVREIRPVERECSV
jgi:hypothetical protein